MPCRAGGTLPRPAASDGAGGGWLAAQARPPQLALQRGVVRVLWWPTADASLRSERAGFYVVAAGFRASVRVWQWPGSLRVCVCL